MVYKLANYWGVAALICYITYSCLRIFHKGYSPIKPSIPVHSANFCWSSSLLGK